MVTTDTFRTALIQVFSEAEKKGLPFIDVRSGDLHSRVGATARMPSCCNAMRSLCDSSDVIVTAPPKGNGANLIIRYQIPRNNNNLRKIRVPEQNTVIIPQENGFTSIFQSLLSRYSDLSELKNLEQLIQVDPQSAMVKIRKTTEKLSQRICKKQNLSFENKSFNDLCFLIADNQILSKKAVNYLHTIRKMGNFYAHPSDSTNDKLSERDVMIMAQALFAIVEESLDEDLI